MCHPIFIFYFYFQAQKQIFNLMKFDSYPRFLKSDLYKQCLSGNVEYPNLEIGLLIHPASNTPTKLKKSLSNAEDRRRKSLLPWHRKNRSKSKDRGETEYSQRKDGPEPVTNNSNKSVSNAHSSQSSLTSLDLAMSCSMHVSFFCIYIYIIQVLLLSFVSFSISLSPGFSIFYIVFCISYLPSGPSSFFFFVATSISSRAAFGIISAFLYHFHPLYKICILQMI